MIRKLGLVLMVLGLAFLWSAGGLSARNRDEDARAGAASAQALSAVEAVLDGEASIPAETEASGSETYLGRLTIPRLGLELPILSEWSYENLKTAPCRYCGEAADGDLVLLAHNYRTHFGPIRRLKPGDLVSFEAMDGTKYEYQVAATEVVAPTDLAAVTAGRYALTLITCTYGGSTRIAVSCDLVSQECHGPAAKSQQARKRQTQPHIARGIPEICALGCLCLYT